ncbi:FHA domain-containing protein [Streptomyces sp. LN699]|uniref:FHA domain-containing protein n=1 Tax=Streptomyces sp. LN699 TaxID=3112981 RepID=UPI003720CA39
MPTCPYGHQSGFEDWCEVCGHRMAAAASAPAAPSHGYGYPPAAGEPRRPEDDWLLPSPPSHEQHAHYQQLQDPHQQPYHQQPFQQEYQQSHHQQPRHEHYRQQPPPQQQEYQQPPSEQYPYQYQQYQQSHQQPHDQVEYQQPPQHDQQQQYYGSQGQAPSYVGGAWSATVGPDRSYFMAMMQRSGPEAAGLNLPAYSPEQHLGLSGGQITIGRRRASSGEFPDIDLSVPPEDPGVSHQHAVLVQQPDGSWAVVDQNSTNGTTINGGEEPIQPYVPIPLGDGDQVHVGAWTTITVRRGEAGGGPRGGSEWKGTDVQGAD